MNDKCLLIFFNNPNEDSQFLDIINKKEKYDAVCALRPVNSVLRAIRKIHIATTSIGIGIWLMPWKHQLSKYDRCICMASGYSGNILRWVKRHNRNIRCINYFWDNVEVSGYPVIESADFDNWTFCKADSIEYGMQYNPQFYLSEMKLPVTEVEYDVSYIGADRNGTLKKRTELLSKLYYLFKELYISGFIWYVSDDETIDAHIRKDDFLPAEEYDSVCSRSRAIIEIVEDNQQWVTQRTLLALANGKKLITNNKTIKEEKYYSTDNVFIIGEDNIVTLKDFVQSDFIEIDKNIIEYYEFENWMKRFC